MAPYDVNSGMCFKYRGWIFGGGGGGGGVLSSNGQYSFTRKFTL